ncbi:MAG: hypothetical protein B6D68_02030 [spirochete symbiont of Stewartia floridana]|nr:MAG: hypothetical protein B6D68_02030 [spirochete symbiont of Stewartia floridana]
MIWNKKGSSKPNQQQKEYDHIINELTVRYTSLIEDNKLNPSLLKSFTSRLNSTKDGGRDIAVFLEEELQEYRNIEQMIQHKENVIQTQEKMLRRVHDGETSADKILQDNRQRIAEYPELRFRPNTDLEIAKLYGAMHYFDSHHWDELESFFRRAFPQPGQIDRMSIEQRFWRFVSTSHDREPNALERYIRVLDTATASKAERHRELREAIKLLAFFLHDIIEVFERAKTVQTPSHQVNEAIDYIRNIIKNFRLQSLKRQN